MPITRRFTRALATLAVGATGLLAAPAAATAAPVAPAAAAAACPPGSTCVVNAQGQVQFQSSGNVSNQWIPSNGYVWNNGRRYPGADHINLRTYVYGRYWTRCVHFGPYSIGADPTAAPMHAGEVVVGWTWRGECADWEEQMH